MIDKKKLNEAIEKLRLQLMMDGGDMELVSASDDGVVEVRLLGHCSLCVHAKNTLKFGIEKFVKKLVPGVKELVSVSIGE